MNYKTQTNQILTITRNGSPDLSFQKALIREQRRRYAVSLAKAAICASIKATRAKLDETMFKWELEAYDKKHKTHLLSEYKQKKQSAKTERMRSLIGQYV